MLRQIIKNILIFTIVMCVGTGLVSASKLDKYKELVRNREFTISYTYESEIPTLYNYNPKPFKAIYGYGDAYEKAAKYYMGKDYIPNMTQLVPEEVTEQSRLYDYNEDLRSVSLPAGAKGIAVINKDNMYSECVTKMQSIHHLKLGKQYLGWKSHYSMFDTPYYSAIGGYIYSSRSSIKLQYVSYDIEMELNYGINLGSTLITRYINAILPDAEHAVYVPSFKLVNATPEYEDYQTYNDGMKEVVRYCFDGDKLTQIMAVVAGYKVDGSPDVHQYKITINQFDNQVDAKYFEVPDYVKIKNKI